MHKNMYVRLWFLETFLRIYYLLTFVGVMALVSTCCYVIIYVVAEYDNCTCRTV